MSKLDKNPIITRIRNGEAVCMSHAPHPDCLVMCVRSEMIGKRCKKCSKYIAKKKYEIKRELLKKANDLLIDPETSETEKNNSI